MIVLTPDAGLSPLPLDKASTVRCAFSYDPAGIDSGRAWRLPDGVSQALPPALSRAVPKRQAEYLAGRYCAALALRQLGADEQVGIRPDRSPRWPAGCIGSISHCDGHALAIAARATDYRSLGIDLEALLDDDTAEQVGGLVLSAQEWRLQPSGWARNRFLTLAFSAKEALYKAIYPLCGRILEFQDACLLAVEAGVATLSLRPALRDAALPDAHYPVRYHFEGPRCLTLLALS